MSHVYQSVTVSVTVWPRIVSITVLLILRCISERTTINSSSRPININSKRNRTITINTTIDVDLTITSVVNITRNITINITITIYIPIRNTLTLTNTHNR